MRMEPPVWFSAARSALGSLLAGSKVPEDPGHARDVERWLIRLRPEAAVDWALRFAALAHDADRALPDEMRVHRADFRAFDDFKTAHAANSARVAAQLLRHAGAPDAVVHDVSWLVLRHEVGGSDARLRALCDADALSFFTHNLPFYLSREGEEEALRRMRWGVARLSANARKRLLRFPFADARIHRLMERATRRLLEEHSTHHTLV